MKCAMSAMGPQLFAVAFHAIRPRHCISGACSEARGLLSFAGWDWHSPTVGLADGWRAIGR